MAKAIKSKSTLTQRRPKTPRLRAVDPAPVEVSPSPQPAQQTADGKKKVSQKLLETLEKRKQNAASGKMGMKPGRRRGRRPKNTEYTPEHREEEGYVLEQDYEGLEYDTGIRVKQNRDDSAFNVERFEDYDEELNFDW